jgi:hypothetical protein
VTDGHQSLTTGQHGFSTKVIDEKDGGNGEDKVDNSNDTSCQKSDGTSSETDLSLGTSKLICCVSLLGTRTHEDCGRVVDDGVDTSPLLESLGTSSEHESVKKWLGSQEAFVFQHGYLECDIVHTVSFLCSFALNQSFGLESSELELNVGSIGGSTTQS